APGQGLGQVGLQGPVEAALQFGKVGQGGRQRVVGGRVRRRIAQAGAGGGQGTDATGGPEQQGPEDPGFALAAVVLQADMPLADGLGVDMDGTAGGGVVGGGGGPPPLWCLWVK